MAKEGFLNGLAAGQQISAIMHIMHALMGLGLVAAAEGQAARAVTLITFGSDRPGPGAIFLLGEPLRVMEELRTKLPPDEFSAAQAQAQEMALPDLLAWL